MDERRTAMTDRIAFAEGWLDRARRHIHEGRFAHGALTMLLAEAELHRAREAHLPAIGASGIPAAQRPWIGWAAASLLAAAAVAVAAFILTARVPPPVGADDAAPPIVTLSGGSGEMFRIITIPGAVVERTVVRSQIVRVAAPHARHAAPQASPGRPPAVRAATTAPVFERPASQAPPAPPVVAAPTPALAAALPLVSDADVIELVLAAERSLRRSANQ